MGESSGTKKITINPVTRIEGHARITIQLDQAGKVSDARFHVNEFRGFEKFCEGRLFTEMPNITPRICGICPVSHAVASAKAGEMIMRVQVPRPGILVRRLVHLGQVISSHALSFFHLSSPDFILGWDFDPARRNIFGVAQRDPDLAKRGIRLRKFGQEISERVTGKKIHLIGIVAGGMLTPLSKEHRKALLEWIPEVLETTKMGLDLFKKYRDANRTEMDQYANFDSLHMGLVSPDGTHELYDGKIRFMGPDGKIVADQLDPARYLDFIAEKPIDWSYLKFPFYKPLGEPAGYYRVGPLSRLNIASRMKTPLADAELKEFKQLGGGRAVNGSMYFHQARLIEILACIEEIRNILQDPEVTSTDTRAGGFRNQPEGIGCSEAPRGILFHHYVTNEDGTLAKVNLLIATGQNNPAMSRSVFEVAKTYVDGKNIRESALNRVEAAIRCYDPCLSCSTHAIGTMPLVIEVRDAEGCLVNVIRRGG